MFCSKCGNKVEENAKFCSKCGSSLDFNDEPTQHANVTSRTESVNELVSELEVALPIYQTLTEMSENIANLKTDKWHILKVLIHSYMKVTICTFGYYLIVGIFRDFLRKNGIIVFLLFGILLVLAGLELFKNHKKLKNKQKSEIEDAENKLREYFTAHECPALYCVPEKYQYYIAVSYIYECLKNGRANSLKEAINLYEEQCYRWKMEASQQQINAKLDQQGRMLNRIDAQQGILAFINLMK